MPSRWPHRAAWALALTTFPLIWMGGLVTTYDAGMAVPDWPQTYGYNLFLYPPASWLQVWDVFLEHSHRLIGAAVGLVAIALAVLLWRHDRRKWIRTLGVIAVAEVCVQGTLGGLRVVGREIVQARILGVPAPAFLATAAGIYALAAQLLLAEPDQRGKAVFWVRTVLVAAACFLAARWGVLAARDKLLLAKMHGSTAPAFFALAAALVVCTSPAWITPARPRSIPHAGRLPPWTATTAGGLFLQILLGVQLRHVAPTTAPGWFVLWVWLHLIVAGLVSAAILRMLLLVRAHGGAEPRTARRVWILAALFALQLVLGVLTWVTNYGWPLWFTGTVWDLHYTVVAEGPWQVVCTTAHVGVGPLCLAAAVSAALWSARLRAPATKTARKTRAARGGKP